MAHYVDLTNKKNKITVTSETDQIAQMACCFLTGAYLPLKAAGTTQIPDLWICNHPLREFSLGGV